MWHSRFYGCGLVAPEALEGMNILDLGSGSGQDCFVLSKLVGENGHVTGVDMTEEQVQLDIYLYIIIKKMQKKAHLSSVLLLITMRH